MKRVLFVMSLAAIAVGFFQIVGQRGVVPQAAAQGRPDVEGQHRRLLPLFELAGVVFTDADESTGRLVVGVLDRDVEPAVRGWLTALGVSPQSVDVIETPPIVQVATLRDQVRPVQGGLQIRFSQYLCSLSFIANRNGALGYVTASHCSDTQGAVDGTLYYQPLNQTPDEFIGTEIADAPFFKFGACPRGRKCRYSDANFSDGADTVSFSIGKIEQTSGANNGSLTITGEFGISGEGTASKDDTANKVGRSTGWTQGQVTRTCVDTGVSGSNIVLLCQTFVENKNAQIVAAGDSGSPVFKGTGPNVTLLGTLWGGDSSGNLFVYSPIDAIKKELGGSITTH